MIEPKKIYYNPHNAKIYTVSYTVSEHFLYSDVEHGIKIIKDELALQIARHIVDNMQYEIRRSITDREILEVIGTMFVYKLTDDEKTQQTNYLNERLLELRKEHELRMYKGSGVTILKKEKQECQKH